MKSWMQQIAAWVSSRRGRTRPDGARRSTGTRGGGLRVEGLERREVLSAAVVTPFFSVAGQVPAAGQVATVDFHLASGTLTAPRGGSTILLGLEPRPAAGATLTPTVTMLLGRGGATSMPAIGSTGAPFLARVSVPGGGDAAYTATVRGQADQSGGFSLDGFLAGDVDGDLKVDKADLDRILAAYGSREGDARYDAAADINQDGRVGCRDKYYAAQNQGAAFTAVAPVATVTAMAATPAVSAPVAASPVVQAPTTVVAVAPVASPVAPIVVTPVVTAAPAAPAVTPVAVATPAAPARSANVVWIPVLTTGDGTSAPAGTIGGLTWSPQASAYYPTTSYGATPYGAPAASFAPVAPTYYAAPAGGYATSAGGVPAGPYYYALPAAGVQGVPTTLSAQAPGYLGNAVR